MKIALLVPNFVEYSGDARVVELQAEELANKGHKVSIFAFAGNIKPKSAELFIMGISKSLFWQRIYRLFFPMNIYKTLLWFPKFKQYDKIIAHLYPMTYFGFLAKKIYGVEYVFWFHGIEDPKLFPHLYERIYMKIQIVLTKFTLKNVDKAVSVSEFAKKKLKEFMGIDSIVIYNKVDEKRFHKKVDGRRIRDKYNLNHSPVILYVGRLVPQKRVDLLIKVFYLVKKEIPNAKLVIVGDPTFKYYYKELKNLSDESAIFAGHVSSEEMPYYYAMCDIYATCSLWENHNLPVLEAQMCGKPIVAFDIDAFKEVINKNSTLVEVGNVEEFAKACINKIREVNLD